MKYKKINYGNVGNNIKRERVMQGLSREALGAKCKLTGATINNLENNTSTALFRNIVTVSEILNVSLETILY